MTTDKQQKAYGVLIIFIVILFLGAQFGLRYILQQSSAELESASTSLASETSTMQSRQSLSKRYEQFENTTKEDNSARRQFPANGNDLFTAITNILKEYSIEFSSGGGAGTPIRGGAGAQAGTQFKITISFNGEYYNFVKALAEIRQSGYIMKLSRLNIEAEGNNKVKGSMEIESRARAQL